MQFAMYILVFLLANHLTPAKTGKYVLTVYVQKDDKHMGPFAVARLIPRLPCVRLLPLLLDVRFKQY